MSSSDAGVLDLLGHRHVVGLGDRHLRWTDDVDAEALELGDEAQRAVRAVTCAPHTTAAVWTS